MGTATEPGRYMAEPFKESVMKMTFGRKFYACLIALLILSSIFFTAVAYCTAAITAGVLIFFGGMVVTVCFAYVGGNVWTDWIKSKYFQADLIGK